LNPEQVAALVALGWVQRTADWDWNGARRSFRRALELAPTSASVMGDAAVLFYNLGLVEEGIALARRAVLLDPLNARAQVGFGFILSNAGRWEECLVPLRQAVALSPSIEEARSHIARALLMVDRIDEAETAGRDEPNEAYRWNAQAKILFRRGRIAEGEKLLADFKAKHGGQMPSYVAGNYATRGELEEAFRWCEVALAQRDAGMPWLKTNSYLRPLRGDPRFEALLRRMGLADDQLQ
jgi:Tfp pilus assembly protein PilF